MEEEDGRIGSTDRSIIMAVGMGPVQRGMHGGGGWEDR